MSENGKDSSNDQLRKSQVEKYEAEKRKLDLEADEIQIRVKSIWHRASPWIKLCAGVLVTAGLLTAWGISYLSPILKKESELSRLDLNIQRSRFVSDSLDNVRWKKELGDENDSLRSTIASLLEGNTEISSFQENSESRIEQQLSLWKKIFNDYAKLAENQESLPEERIRYDRLAGEIKNEVDSLANQRLTLQEAQRDSRKRGNFLSEKLTIYSLIGTKWFYRDSDGDEGQIVFRPGGRLSWWDKSDENPENDFWRISENKIIIEINNGISKHVGTLSPKGSQITGTAKSSLGQHTWTWNAKKIE